MRIAMFSAKPYDKIYFEQYNSEHTFRYLDVHLTEQTAALADGCEAVCCFVNDDLSAAVLTQLKQLNVAVVALRCAGFNQVDLVCARTLGILVCRVPEYSPFAVAEHAVALILALNRNLHRAYNRVRESDYSLNGLMGFDLHGKKVGVIGAGKIGRVFIRIMAGFGCQVLVHDDYRDAEVAAVARYCELQTLWREADIISLHCPLTPATQHLIDAEAISQMKPGVMVINTSRGALVDTKAVITALKSGQIGYLGLDVYEEEGDLFFDDLSNQVIQDDVFARLTTFPNVIITGHQAFFTREALQQIAQVTLQNLAAYASQNYDAMALVRS